MVLKRRAVFIVIGVLLLVSEQVFAQQAQSPNFQIYGGQITPIVGSNITSPGFSLDAGGNPIGGRSESTSFSARQGAPVGRALVATPAATSGDGGGFALPGGPTYPMVRDVKVESIGISEIDISFETDILAVARLRYGSDEEQRDQTPEEISFSYTHQFRLPLISPNQLYTFTIVVRSVSGGIEEVGPYEFIIDIPVAVSVPNVTRFIAVPEADHIKLSWVLPVFDTFREVRLMRSESGFITDPEQGETIFRGTAAEFIDRNVSAEISYYYTVFVYDVDGQASSGAVTGVRIALLEDQDIPPGRPPRSPVATVREDDEAPAQPDDQEEPRPQETPEELLPDIVPAQPPALPPDVRPVVPEESSALETAWDKVSLFSIVEQSVAKKYVALLDQLNRLPQVVREQLRTVQDSLVDQFGRVRQDVFSRLSPSEYSQVAEITEIDVVPQVTNPEEESPVVKSTVVHLDISAGEIGGHVFAGSEAILYIPGDVFRKPVEVIILTIGTDAYVLQYREKTNVYETKIQMPDIKGNYEMLLQVIYEDHTFEELHRTILIDPYGVVYTKRHKTWSWKRPWQVFFREDQPIANVEVTLFTKTRTDEWVMWPAHLYNQFNPVQTNDMGEFAFVAPPGEYHLTAMRDGYDKHESDAFEVNGRVVNMNIFLTRSDTAWFRYILVGSGIIAFVLWVIFLRNQKNKS